MLLTEYNEKKAMEWLKKEAREEGRIEGRQEGRIEGKIDLVRKKAAKGRSPEEIAEMLEEDISEIMEICEMLNCHPEWSDERIYAEMKS